MKTCVLVLLWIGCCLGSPGASKPDKAAQAEALRRLYKSTGGPNWRHRLHWEDAMESGNFCVSPLQRPYGITCNPAGYVNMISLGRNNLVGTIPSLKNLTSLETLDLSFNELSSSIPTTINALNILETFQLNNNNFSGSFDISELLNGELHTIDLSFNSLGGCLPSNIPMSPDVVYLDFSNNAISGVVPMEFGNMEFVRSISIGSNPISGTLPVRMTELSRLELLLIDNARVSGTIPAAFEELVRLSRVNFSSNLLSGTLPNFDSVVDLEIEDNNLSGNVPAWAACVPDVICKLSGNPLIKCQSECLGNHCGVMACRQCPPAPCNASHPCRSWGVVNCSVCSKGLCQSPSPPPGTSTTTGGSTTSHSPFVAFLDQYGALAMMGAVFVCCCPLLALAYTRRTRADRNRGGYDAIPEALPTSSSIHEGLTFAIEQTELEVIPWSELTIGEVIGTGAYGTVYRARRGGTDVAVKMMKNIKTVIEAQDFADEISVLNKLKHPNCVLIMGVCTDPGHFAIVTEYLMGGDLHTLLYGDDPTDGLGKKRRKSEEHKPPSIFVRLCLLRDAALGLEYLHKRGIPHRDVKLANVLLDDRTPPTGKLADFGLSGHKIFNVRGGGTVGYVAPEVKAQMKEADPPADMYSFGVMCSECMHLRIPARALEESDPPMAAPAGWPKYIGDLSTLCLAADPTRRPAASECIEVLREALTDLSKRAHKSGGSVSSVESGERLSINSPGPMPVRTLSLGRVPDGRPSTIR